MQKVRSKRRITLSIDLCRLAGIVPGVDCETFVDNDGHIRIVKKVVGAAPEFREGTRARVKSKSKI